MTEVGQIYLGSRGPDFKDLIAGLLRRGKLKAKYIDILTNEEGMKAYGQAFTAVTADPINNYERYEQLGDVSANKFIVWYAYRRFPQLRCTQGVPVVARLRINYGAKHTFAPLAEKLGFWDFISAKEDGEDRGTHIYYRSRNKKDLLEDTFEAFVGCTEYLLDQAYRPGVGYGIVYDILSDIFDEMTISLKWEELFDARTRLKETFDKFQDLGNWVYIDIREEVGDDGYTRAKSVLYRAPVGTANRANRIKTGPGKNDYIEQPQNGWVEIGMGTASSKKEAQERAAEVGLRTLKHLGYYREPPEVYKHFCE